jgi:hypothetical protein
MDVRCLFGGNWHKVSRWVCQEWLVWEKQWYSFGTRKHWRLMACFTKTTWQTASHWSVAVASWAQWTMTLLCTWCACRTKWQSVLQEVDANKAVKCIPGLAG